MKKILILTTYNIGRYNIDNNIKYKINPPASSAGKELVVEDATDASYSVAEVVVKKSGGRWGTYHCHHWVHHYLGWWAGISKK